MTLPEQPRPPSSRVPLRALAAVALWGGSFVAVRLALPGFTPSGLVAVRMLIGSLLLWALLLSRTPKGQRLVHPDDLPRCILAWGVLYQTAWLAVYAVGVFSVFQMFILLHEEPHLQREFGSEFADYKTRIGRWLPRRPSAG